MVFKSNNLDITEYILGFLIPAVSQFPYDIINTWHGLDLKEILGNLTTSIDDDDENATNVDVVEEKKEHEEEERNKDSKNNIDDAATNGVEYMTRLEVILVDCQVEIVESSEEGAGALTLNFHTGHVWHDSAHGFVNDKSAFLQNGGFNTTYIDNHFEPIEYFQEEEKSSEEVALQKQIDNDLLAINRNGSRNRNGLRISLFDIDLCTVEDTSICGHGIDLHCTLHLADHMDDDIQVIIQTTNLPLSLTKAQYRTVLAMIFGNFSENASMCTAQVPKCPKCGGTHFPVQTCRKAWCYVDILAYHAHLEILESGSAPASQRMVSTLNFENLIYRIELLTDDTMTQDALSRTVEILDSNSQCISNDSFRSLLGPLSSKEEMQNQLEYHQLSTYFELTCEVKVFDSQIHVLGGMLPNLISYFVDPIYTFPDDPNYGYLIYSNKRQEVIRAEHPELNIVTKTSVVSEMMQEEWSKLDTAGEKNTRMNLIRSMV